MFHRILEVEPLSDLVLRVAFHSGEIKKYDVKPLLDKWEPFKALKQPGLFTAVKVDVGGYGVIWNDDIDLSCDELYENGEAVPQ